MAAAGAPHRDGRHPGGTGTGRGVSGAGKTRFGLEIAYRLAEAGEISRVLIIVPTIGIADGWRTARPLGAAHTDAALARAARMACGGSDR